ncbi:synaptic vesicle glycoprotein 2B-like [Melitaea cinxia]|uniref:synaptic vesicle glycoprotein 2B-like n=1 Tax=Melitaea cinxia TaxID=113334 RepID=UPI001E26FDC7|nr:synaptic vesicle glycoprotein 2B-like [Melitaea cinxia]
MVAVKSDIEAPAVTQEIPHDHLYKVTGLAASNSEKLAQEPPAADFEDAISATGYGWFNVALMLRTLPAFWSSVSVTSAASYIFTRAQCDMNLRLLDMGTVTAMTYIGMISSAVIWGFLSDTLGRKKFLVWGFFCSGLIEIAAAMSQNFTMLLVTRFMSGFLFNGPFAVLLTYIAELHRTDLRARVLLLTGLFFTIASTTLPLLAWATMVEDWDYTIFGNFVIHSWNIFLLATALVPLLTGVAFLCLPESPKFLMSRGRNEEALEVFRKIYSMNTGKPPETFSITKLVEERPEQRSRGLAALKEGRFQFTPLFKVPHLTWLLLVCGAHLGCMFGSNTIRLWYPQLAAMVGSDGNEDLCSAIAPQQTDLVTESCLPIETDMLTYLQSAVVGAGSVVTYCIGGALINRCGKKIVPGVSGILSAVFIVMLPLIANSALTMTAVVTTALALTSLCSAALSSIAVDLFPTSLRVMAMALFLMTGRIGTILGTVIFPALINFGCLPPFIAISAVLSLCGLTCFFLPNTTLKKLE